MINYQSRRLAVFASLAFFTLALIFAYLKFNYFHHSPPPSFQTTVKCSVTGPSSFNGTWDYKRDAKNLVLSQDQCDQAFPDLYDEINRAVDRRKPNHITFKEVDETGKSWGYMRLMIYDQELYIIAKEESVNSRNMATLHAIHKAMLTSPEPIPNIEFTLNGQDRIGDSPSWSYTRHERDENTWVMPDFGFWSWPEALIGAYSEVALKAAKVDSEITWEQKIDKLVWRGATLSMKVREDFLNKTAGKEWADVVELKWAEKDNFEKNYITMDEHCKYRFVAHTEGVSYSGRLKYIQNCRSTVVTHKLEWVQHYHHLMKSSGTEQNYIEVDREFNNLEKTMMKMRFHHEEAERIADRSYKLFRERYLTPAAEACYWRRLFAGWAAVSFEPEFFEEKDGKKIWRGIPIESYMLMGQLSWNT